MSLCTMPWGSIHWNSRDGKHLLPNPLGPQACLFNEGDLSTFPVLERAFGGPSSEAKEVLNAGR